MAYIKHDPRARSQSDRAVSKMPEQANEPLGTNRKAIQNNEPREEAGSNRSALKEAQD
jgi:hypothetical protein